VAEQDRSRRTERPTPRRLEKAREQGKAPRSAEVSAVVVLAGFLLFAATFGERWLGQVQETLAGSLAGLHRFEPLFDEPAKLLRSAGWAAGSLLLLPLGALAAAGLAGNLLQGPPPLSWAPLAPSWERLSPASNLKRLFSARAGVEALRVLLKAGLYAAVGYTAAREALRVSSTQAAGAESVLAIVLDLGRTILFRIGLLAAGLAVLDYLFRRYDHLRSLRMTRTEVRDERKELEGDPLVRSRIRSRMMALARSRMMAEVPRATVVVVNPTRYAVALKYRHGETPVPRVVAKGRERLAARIRDIAESHGVPIVCDPPLARSLYRTVPVGAEIPPSLFRAVAEVLAMVLAPRKAASSGHVRGEVRP